MTRCARRGLHPPRAHATRKDDHARAPAAGVRPVRRARQAARANSRALSSMHRRPPRHSKWPSCAPRLRTGAARSPTPMAGARAARCRRPRSNAEPRYVRRLVVVAGRRRASPAIWWSAVRSKRAPFWCVPPVLEQKPTILAQHSLRRDLRGGDHDDADHGERVQDRSAAQPPVRLSSRAVRIPFVFMLLLVRSRGPSW